MASFGNYDMPLWSKTGAKAEHLAVIMAAGMFDTSHMAVVAVRAAGVGFGWQGTLTPEQAVEMGQALIATAAQVRNIRNLATAAVQGGAA